jgi:6-phosphogluconolactonase
MTEIAAPDLEGFPTREAQVDAAVAAIADALPPAGPATLVVTGGSTPGPLYDRLARRRLGWDRITVTLTDDRWVEPTSPDSNERLVRERLLVGPAAEAAFVPLKRGDYSPQYDARAAEPDIAALLPSAAVVLGMGEDGHIASLFPNDPNLAERLDPSPGPLVVGVTTPGLPPLVRRVSLTVRALILTRLVLLYITGEAKRVLVERVRADQTYQPPVAAILRQDLAPVRVLWAA